MKKVICINDMLYGKQLTIKFGKIYTASQCPVYPNNYDLAEHLRNPITGKLASYRKFLFADVSSIDETEFERSYNKELV